jgi:hypothetical protein
MRTERRLAGLPNGFVRADRQKSLSDAIDWVMKRGCNEETRPIFEALATLLAEFNATVQPVRRTSPEGVQTEVGISLSRLCEDRTIQRMRFVVTHSGGEEKTDRHGFLRLRVTVDECVRAPWETAARVVGEILRLAAEASGEEPEAAQPKEDENEEMCVDSG